MPTGSRGFAHLEARRREIIAAIVAGDRSLTQIAKDFGASERGLADFRERHAKEIARLRERLERRVEDYAIASKAQRIADLDMLRQGCIDELEAQGIVWTDLTRNGPYRRVNETARLLLDVLRQAAEELDQLPRGPTGAPFVSQQNITVYVRGVDPAQIE